MRSFVFTYSILCTLIATAQFTDDFSDGDFLIDPQWSGDTSEFIVERNQLRLNNNSAGAANESYLSLESRAISDAVWEFKVGFDGLPRGGLSGSNQMFIYLTADQPDLKGRPNGYYVLVGGTNDEISLYSSSSGELIDGVDDVTMTSDTLIRVQVTRDKEGNWELFLGGQEEVNLISQGQTNNVDFTSSAYFGVLCDYTSTRSNSFFFDDFHVTGKAAVDSIPPVATSVEIVSNAELTVRFNESLERLSAEKISNYRLKEGVITSAELVEDDEVSLKVDDLVANTPNVITIQSIEDRNGNTMPTQSIAFTYYVTQSADPGDIIVNEFLSDPLNSNDDFIELYNRSEKFISLEGWTISDESSTSPSFDLMVMEPDSFVIIYDEDASIDYFEFGKSLTVPSLTLNNDNDVIEIKDEKGLSVVKLEYGIIMEEGVSLELINPHDPCISFDSYLHSIDPLGGTPGKINSVFDNTPDTSAPEVASFRLINSLEINFSESMDKESLTNASNYHVPSLEIKEIIVADSYPVSVELRFEQELIPGHPYEIVLNGLADCSGNTIAPTVITFGSGRSPTFNELFFTEVLFDELPSVGLPEREYIELFNATQDIISTAGLWLSDATRSVELPDANLDPNTYYVLTSTSGSSEFSTAIGIIGFPSLNNAGEQLTLSLDDQLVSSLNYDPEWHEIEKADGGYSLELIDITNPCLESRSNWRSSEDSRGGTPGRPNSVTEVIPDNFGPEVMRVSAISPDTIRVDMNENIDPVSEALTLVQLQPSVSIQEIIVDYKFPKSIFIVLKQEMEINLSYILELSKIQDCAGNEMQPSQQVFALPVQARQGEIKLSEVLFNPRTNGVDFVEIYNDSENYISLKDWRIARLTDEGIDDERIISLEEMVINPNAYLALTVDKKILLANYPKGRSESIFVIPSLPPFANDTGNVILLNHYHEEMDRFFYDEDFHYNLLERVDGVSLERISFSNPTNDRNNWRSASSTEGFATPGYMNSQAAPIKSTSASLEVSPKVFVPGNTGSGRDFTIINYRFSNPGQFANVNIYDQNGRLIRNLAQGALLSTTGFLRWDGETNRGSMARLGYYVILFEVYDGNGNTEFLKETVAVGRDF